VADTGKDTRIERSSREVPDDPTDLGGGGWLAAANARSVSSALVPFSDITISHRVSLLIVNMPSRPVLVPSFWVNWDWKKRSGSVIVGTSLRVSLLIRRPPSSALMALKNVKLMNILQIINLYSLYPKRGNVAD
jgi:hypothetical protein